MNLSTHLLQEVHIISMVAISTIMRAPKSLAFSFMDFEFMSTNHVAATYEKNK